MIKQKKDFLIEILLDSRSKTEKKKFRDYLHHFSDKQRQFLESPKKFRVIKGGARAGKTAAAIFAVFLDNETIGPGQEGHAFIASQTIDKGRELYWNKLQKISQRFNAGWKFLNSQNKIKTPEDTTIHFISLHSKSSAEIAQGFPTKFIHIEEPQLIKIPILDFFITEVTETRLIDFSKEGSCYRLMANPATYVNPLLKELYSGPLTECVHVTIFDNPKWKKEKRNIVEDVTNNAKKKGLTFEETKTDPAMARQYWGIDMIDEDKLVFNPNKENLYDSLPEKIKTWHTVMGVDIGFHHQNAIVVCHYSHDTREIYIEYENGWSKQNVTQLGTQITMLAEKYNPSVIVVDQGGPGSKNIATEISTRYTNIHLEPAEKTDKVTWIKILQAEILERNVKFKKKNLMKMEYIKDGKTFTKFNHYIKLPSIYEEMDQILWNDRGDGFDDTEGIHSDRVDALLYAFRFIYSYIQRKKLPPDKILNEEEKEKKLIDLRDRVIKKQELRRFRREKHSMMRESRRRRKYI